MATLMATLVLMIVPLHSGAVRPPTPQQQIAQWNAQWTRNRQRIYIGEPGNWF